MNSSYDLYNERKLAEGYPNLHELAHKEFFHEMSLKPDDSPHIERLVTYIGRLVDLSESREILVLGCGPQPQPMLILTRMGHRVVGVEPVQSFVETARQYLDAPASVLTGSAEHIPLPDNSQEIVFFESVLEHVDSIPQSLEEIYRVLAPGGVLYLTTTNRHRFSLKGENGEYNVPFYNWFPRLVKEGYIFEHLHYNPKLANYSLRPAVHWLSFTDLCRLGRDAGFAQFYSNVDLMQISDPRIAKSRLRRTFLPYVQRNPWLRALALTQTGHVIFMLKRKQ